MNCEVCLSLCGRKPIELEFESSDLVIIGKVIQEFNDNLTNKVLVEEVFKGIVYSDTILIENVGDEEGCSASIYLGKTFIIYCKQYLLKNKYYLEACSRTMEFNIKEANQLKVLSAKSNFELPFGNIRTPLKFNSLSFENALMYDFGENSKVNYSSNLRHNIYGNFEIGLNFNYNRTLNTATPTLERTRLSSTIKYGQFFATGDIIPNIENKRNYRVGAMLLHNLYLYKTKKLNPIVYSNFSNINMYYDLSRNDDVNDLYVNITNFTDVYFGFNSYSKIVIDLKTNLINKNRYFSLGLGLTILPAVELKDKSYSFSNNEYSLFGIYRYDNGVNIFGIGVGLNYMKF